VNYIINQLLLITQTDVRNALGQEKVFIGVNVIAIVLTVSLNTALHLMYLTKTAN
jgi:hypothetical protein